VAPGALEQKLFCDLFASTPAEKCSMNITDGEKHKINAKIHMGHITVKYATKSV